MCGYNIQDLVKGAIADQRPAFEETAYLLLFGELPYKKELAEFTGMIGDMRRLPTNFVRDVIMKAPSKDIMNSMTRSVLTLSSYDPNDIVSLLQSKQKARWCSYCHPPPYHQKNREY